VIYDAFSSGSGHWSCHRRECVDMESSCIAGQYLKHSV
jgi:hypothetical protein